MELAKKQRVTGAIVLFVAVLLLYPLLFNTSVFREGSPQPIPAPLTAPDAPAYLATLDSSMPALPAEPVDDEELKANDNTSPELDSEQMPVSWTLQLAAFVKRENAFALRDRLRKEAYRAYTRTLTLSEGQSVTRVYVGPDLVREKSETLLAKLKEGYQLEGLVVRYRP